MIQILMPFMQKQSLGSQNHTHHSGSQLGRTHFRLQRPGWLPLPYGRTHHKNGGQSMTLPLPDFDSLWDYNHPDETEQKFRELLPVAEVSGDDSYYAELLTQ